MFVRKGGDFVASVRARAFERQNASLKKTSNLIFSLQHKKGVMGYTNAPIFGEPHFNGNFPE
jgi:hypothetical protein